LIFYTCWEFLILTLIPSEGPSGLVAIAHGNHPMKAMTEVLQYNLGLTFIATAVGVFSFCALVTSFLAVNLSLRDFLTDGFKIEKDTKGRIIVSILTLLPPLIYAIAFPKGFTVALGYGGVFVAIIYGILPALMVYKGRYEEKLQTVYTAPGGKAGLIIVLLGSVMIMLFQVASTLQWLPS
jgi:tyrosine-specific transport protein